MRVLFVNRPLLIIAVTIIILLSVLGMRLCLFPFPSVSTWSTSDSQPIYQGSSQKKEMALTCNVFWGEEFLPEMLAILRRNEVPMTFFIGGTWAEKFPDMVQKLAREGHEIGSHGYSHPHPDRLSREDNLEDILKCERILKEITGVKPVLYAPPYGERGPAVLQAAEEAGYRTILWSIDTVDWKHPEPEVIVDKIVKNAHNGAIVLMHPTAPTVYALPEIINKIKEKGFTFVTVSELIQDEKTGENGINN